MVDMGMAGMCNMSGMKMGTPTAEPAASATQHQPDEMEGMDMGGQQPSTPTPSDAASQA